MDDYTSTMNKIIEERQLECNKSIEQSTGFTGKK